MRTSSSSTKSGQVPVHDMKPVASSVTRGGQAGVRSTAEGDRGGDLNSRGFVSPLGGVSNPNSARDNSQREERSEGPRGPMPKPQM